MLTMVLLCLAAAFSETADIILSNNESSVLFYSLDPDFNLTLSPSSGTTDFFTTNNRIKFSSLSPFSSVRIEKLALGSHTIIGFWGQQGASDNSVWSLQISLADGQLKKFSLKKSGAQITMNNVEGDIKNQIPITPIVIDNSYTDWIDYPAMAVFPSTYAPERFTQQSKAGENLLPIRESNFWGKGGTQLATMKALFSAQTLYLYFSSTTPFSPGLSIFFYLFNERQENDLNFYTLEIPIETDSGEGRILLWQRGQTSYEVVGTFKTANFFLEGAVDLGKLPTLLAANLYDKYSFDLKTSYFDSVRKFYEDFFFTSAFFKDFYSRK
jgi:hypothetical protein